MSRLYRKKTQLSRRDDRFIVFARINNYRRPIFSPFYRASVFPPAGVRHTWQQPVPEIRLNNTICGGESGDKTRDCNHLTTIITATARVDKSCARRIYSTPRRPTLHDHCFLSYSIFVKYEIRLSYYKRFIQLVDIISDSTGGWYELVRVPRVKYLRPRRKL